MAQVSIRPTEPFDVDFLVAAEDDPEVSPQIGPRTAERHMQALEDEGIDHLLIEADGRPVGFALLTDLTSRNDNFEINTIVVTKRNRGYGQAALRLIIDRAFEVHGAHRVWLDAVGGNDRARHTYEKLGFKYEGEWREAWRREDGSYDSLVFLGMLESEWRAVRDR